MADRDTNVRDAAEAPANAPSCGSLSIVATPIGNLEDITLRALRVLKEADTILCEDTRIADPGFLLVREAVEAGIEPEIVPGVSAVIFSIAASALPSDRFAFHGFLPVKSGRRAARLEEIAATKLTAVVFESPYRLSKLLNEIPRYFCPEVPVVIVREATKVHQEILRGTAAELAEKHGKRTWKGECVVIIGAASGDAEKDGRAENGEHDE